MRAPEGGFFASQDADSEGEEGVYYVLTPEQIDAVARLAAGRRLLPRLRRDGPRQLRARQQRAGRRRARAARTLRRRARGAAGRAREPRPLPRPTASASPPGMRWRSRASRAPGSLIGDDAMLADALAAAEFVDDRMRDGVGRLARIWNEGRAWVPAFLDDYASWLEATLDLHRAGAGERWLGAALRRGRLHRRALLRPGRGRPLPDAGGRRAARAPPALGPRRRDAALDRARGARAAAHGRSRGPRAICAGSRSA